MFEQILSMLDFMPFLIGAVTVGVYNIFKTNVMAGVEGSYTLKGTAGATNPVFLALVNNSYSFDADHKFAGEFMGTYQISGAGYAVGGHALSAPALTQDDTDDEGVFDAGDWQIGGSSVTARGGVLYASTGVGADLNGTLHTSDPLIAFVDFGQDEVSATGNFTIQWAAEGILNLT